jgi:hypothetical protein
LLIFILYLAFFALVPMASLQHEFSKFAKNKRRLIKILNDTQVSLAEITKSNYFTKGKHNKITIDS